MIEQGASFEGYRVERMLGRGGMGVVYEAVQLSLGRSVALKVLRPELAEDEAFVRRFRREGKLQASLEHPHVLDVYEVGESEHGLFLAMRLVRGRTIAELIRAGDLGAARALRLFAEVASALDAAHAIGLVHRDVKPENMLVDENGTAYLADFGLTRASDGTAATAARPLLGTFAYAAPEVIRGEEPTPASDRYSFAAALFQALTGEDVFPRGSDAAVLYAHASEPPPRISGRRAELPAGLDPTFSDGLAKEAAARPESAQAMVDAVAKTLDDAGAGDLGPPEPGSPVSMATSPVAPGPTAAPRPRRRDLVLLGLAILAAAAVGALVAALIDDGDGGGDELPVPPLRAEAQALGSDLTSFDRSVNCRGSAPGQPAPSCAIVQTELPGATLLVPEDGAIVGWSVRGAHGDMALDVIRARGEDTSRVARSQYEFAGNDGAFHFPANLAVERGDLLGVELGAGASIGIREVEGATTERWLEPAGGAFGAADRGPGTGFDYELMLRVDFEPGGEFRLPRQLTGPEAAGAPPGRVLDSDPLRISKHDVTVELALVELRDSVAVDLFEGDQRRARMFLPGLIPGGEPFSLKSIYYEGEAFGEVDVYWVNPNSGRMIFHFATVYPNHFEFTG